MNAVTFGKKKEEQVKVPTKKSNFKDPEIKVNSQKKSFQSYEMREEKDRNVVVSVNKKRPTGLQDYLGNSAKKNNQKENINKEKSVSVTKKDVPMSYATMLQKQ